MTVELYDSHRNYSAPAGAKLVYGGGPLLTNVKLVGVYVDDFPFQKEMSGYLDFLATSDVLGELAEYSTGLGSHVGDYTLSLSGGTPPPPPPPPVPGPPPPPKPAPCPAGCVPASGKHHHKKHGGWLRLLDGLREKSSPTNTVVQDADLQKLIGDSISAGSLPAPDSETLYVLFLPSGVVVDMGSDASCTTFCGYHDSFQLNGGNVFYAILPYPDCDGCLGGLTAFDALTGTTSHEVCEAITDPIPGQGWYDQQNGEIGDICAWQFRQDGQYNVQLEWSNQHGACI